MSIIRYIIFTVVLISLAFCNGCKQHPEYRFIDTQNGAWELVWNDEFDYTGLPDPHKWNFDTAGNEWGWGDNELQWNTSENEENARVENGILILSALKKEMNGKQYTSARLTTKGKSEAMYGRIEVKAKLPEGAGLWSSVWMLPTETADWITDGRIDIMQHAGYDPDTIYTTVQTEKYNRLSKTEVENLTNCHTATSEFHVYSIEWDENQIRSYVDGEHYFTFRNDNEGYGTWPFDQKFYLLLNIAVGGNKGGREGIDDRLFPCRMEVDYVRIYKKLS